jgi:hypothetical protein
MGIDPGRVEYLKAAGDRLGITEESRIEQRGEAIHSVRVNFGLIDAFRQYRLA